MTNHNAQHARGRWSLAGVALAALLALPLAACDLDSVLEVEDPDKANPGSLADSASAPVVLAGAIGDFQVAFNGLDDGDGLVASVGLFTDEFYSSDTFPTRNEEDQRNIDPRDNSEVLGTYLDVQQARVGARRAASLIEGQSPSFRTGLSLARSLEGFTQVMLAENFCSGVPLSEEVEGELVFGAPQTTEQLFTAALASFDAALAAAPDAQTQNLARVGRARTLLNLNRPAEAATAVAGVPTGFSYVVESSANSTRQNNGLWTLASNGRWSVASGEGGNGLPFRAANDPRVPWEDTQSLGFDQETPLYMQLKYPARESGTPLATGIEARLIEAEAALRAGNGAAALTALNTLRAGANLPALPGTTVSVDQLFQERAFWLYATAHRLGDLRRLIRQYGRTEDQVFPTGAFHKGGEYGNDVNFPLPIEETNNPNVGEGCINRNA